MNLPEEYQKKIKKLLGIEYEIYRDSFSQRYGQTLRVNRLKTEPADFIRRFILKEAVPWCENGFYCDRPERISQHPFYYGGVYYLQEPSAMAPAEFLPVEPGEKVLDLCAAPGGKSTALAGKLGGEGFLLSNDISASRCKGLLKNMEMAGVTNSVITCELPEKLAARFPAYFDKVLVDAPCSGEGMFRREPSMTREWSVQEVERYSRLQREILEQAAKMVRPGGSLLYSTCTFSPEEDEQTVEYFLEKEPDFFLEELPLAKGVERGRPEWGTGGSEHLSYCRRFWPHRVKGEGHFAALFSRKQTANPAREAGAGTTNQMPAFHGKIPKEMEEFFRDLFAKEEGPETKRLFFLKERAFLLPENCPDFTGLRVLRSGLYLGDCLKKRFEPSQALAMAKSSQACKNVLSLSLEDVRIEKYLRGETLAIQEGEISKAGWTLVCAEEFPLGWGKYSQGRLKNKYHTGWRKM